MTMHDPYPAFFGIETYAAVTLAGQTDKAGEPVVNHAIRMANVMREAQAPPWAVYAALLHDVLEDSPISEKSLRASVERIAWDTMTQIQRHQTVASVLALTRLDGETYAEYIDRLSRGDTDVIGIKLADLNDHLTGPTAHAISGPLRERYGKALRKLTEALMQRMVTRLGDVLEAEALVNPPAEPASPRQSVSLTEEWEPMDGAPRGGITRWVVRQNGVVVHEGPFREPAETSFTRTKTAVSGATAPV